MSRRAIIDWLKILQVKLNNNFRITAALPVEEHGENCHVFFMTKTAIYISYNLVVFLVNL